MARIMGSSRTKAPNPNLVSPSAEGDGEDKTYLLFTTGSLTYSPHQIGECTFVFFIQHTVRLMTEGVYDRVLSLV